ncbi:hypothetical protein ACF09K_22105 [Streptomyces sp. NPDC014882]|uniref:DUF7144 family membrane protein n=1 Tax=Streptomyces sp. NPDC014882 TaxID=3364927 RepID=UPI00370293B2
MADGGTPPGDTGRSAGTGGEGGTGGTSAAGGSGGEGGPGGAGRERAGRGRAGREPPPEDRPRGGPPGEIGTAWSVPRGGPRPPDGPVTGTTDRLRPPDGPGDGTSGPPGTRVTTTGGVTRAGTLLLCGGFLALLQGVAAIAGDDVHADVGSYVYGLGLTGWGWIHLVLGVLAAVTGASLLRGSSRARVPGVLLASLGLVAQFLFLPYEFLPYEPVRSAVVMAVDVLVIRALAS